jgi:hypothetical protein
VIKVQASFVAAIPHGHHVTVFALEIQGLFSSEFSPTKQVIICDDDTRVVYANRGIGGEDFFYHSLELGPDSPFRISPTLPPLRGRVVACTVRTDSGSTVYNETTLLIEPDQQPYR